MTRTGRPAWVDDKLFPFESRFVDIDGHTVHYVDEGAGHFVQSDAPEEFAAAIRGWWSAPDGRRTSPARGDNRRTTPRQP
jgi:hypothetical protein